MWNEKDQRLMSDKGITESVIEAQLKRFETGFPWLKLAAVATVGNGIIRLDPKKETQCIKSWKEFQGGGTTIEKFQPASGAASRMFKNLFAFVNEGKAAPDTDFERQFFEGITQFAFYPQLNKTCVSLYQNNVGELMEAGRYVDILKALLLPEGMNYGALPKALLRFHRAAAGTVHTPLEEHLEEGAQYAADSRRRVSIHFTVSPEHRAGFEKLIKAKVPLMEKVWGVTYDITLSEQKASTDTIAVKMDNTPYRDNDGNLLFRPAGHGALLENLNERDADVVFIKNVDNVVPLRLRSVTTRYKKVLGGYLVQVQRQLKKYLETLDKPNPKSSDLKAMLRYARQTLFIVDEATDSMDDAALAEWLRDKFNRPIRVCGVVPNEGEPGGGPYLAYNPDGSYSPQILESAQINPDAPEAVEMMRSGTHFNPVDLVCYIKDYKGIKFDLRKFVDPDTGFISIKSKDGVDIKALELPGLWNGSMSNWNTVFVEVPIDTFNPVKTVNDLLRRAHQ
ncbi:MAG: DUF4301 family protein [Muribaculaceae bacterium]|nr:DUF4301 family protein [Muribaculaceae bacterium]